MKFKALFVILITTSCLCQAQTGKNDSLVNGASFIDRFLPIESKNVVSNVWGAKNVIPRDINNGIEDAEYSYWGGNIVHGDDGKEHLFVARWREDISRPNGKSGHNLWWASEVVHAVSNNPLGRYKVIDVIGAGHNPEIYRLNDGSYIIGVMGNKAYKAPNLNGPWTQIETIFNFLDKKQNPTNRTYVVRKDGSVLMMNKEGYLFVSENANEHFVELDAVPAFKRKKETHEEDPVIWKDEVQYNLIMNDAFGRKAYHLTSKDGIHNWTFEEGIAYNPDILKHVGGSLGNWWKLERPKIRKDKYGRATHINFAAIDTLKNNDLANDNHSSKNIVLPLKIQKRVSILNKEKIDDSTEKIVLKIISEKGFNAITDLNLNSLKLGSSFEVNRGRGSNVIFSRIMGEDLIVVFDGKKIGITEKDYKLKLLGKTKQGEVIFGYARLP
ncbi:hypothetical protein SAMN05444411_101427 [Lutibacter oricola]|uniref:BNR repeat-containing family member n=1 Tax=Lutibacter oricola TaxID=762486 RepID=A0A1H2SCG5_9FLAO|nr:glycoside hydrolase family protein [Lutibacter oricola]SDW29197.1 hypothetical protein SAMN05444411_101427 [Lutibacter oricola]